MTKLADIWNILGYSGVVDQGLIADDEENFIMTVTVLHGS